MGILTERFKKWIPDALQYFLNPLLIMLITLPVTLLIFGPLGTWIGDALFFVCDILQNTVGSWAVTALYAACQPFLILLGAGNFVMPVIMQMLSEQGYDSIFYMLQQFQILLLQEPCLVTSCVLVKQNNVNYLAQLVLLR